VNFLDIVFASLLANNLLFFHFLGLGEFLSSERTPNLVRRTLVLAVLLVAAAVCYWVPDHFLLQALHLEFLRTVLLLVDLFLVLGIYSLGFRFHEGPSVWPLPGELLVHSFLVGGVLFVGSSSPDLWEVVTAAVAVAIGYGAALVLLGSIFRRLSRETIPKFIQGLPLRLLTLGLIWLVLHGLGFAFAGKAS
jgi:electron transport complex protein RnfA